MPKVEVLNFRPFTGQGSLKGFAEVKIANRLIIRDIRLIQVAGKEAFVSPPQKEYTNREGEKKYLKLNEWPEEWDTDIRHAIIAASLEQEDQSYQEPVQRPQRTPQGGTRQDSYQSDYVQPSRTTQPQPRRAPVPDAYDDELQDPFME